jgi:hypothetical protein
MLACCLELRMRIALAWKALLNALGTTNEWIVSKINQRFAIILSPISKICYGFVH